MDTTTTTPLPVGGSVIFSPAGWAWELCAEGVQKQGVFDGPKAHLADHLRDLVATFSAGREIFPVLRGTLREEFAQGNAEPSVREEAFRLANQAHERVYSRHPVRLRPPKHTDRPATRPFLFNPDQLGKVACDGAVDAELGYGAWAVTSEAGWYQCGIIRADPGNLHVITAELIALHRATVFARRMADQAVVFNDNEQAVHAARLLGRDGDKQEVFLRWPVVLQQPIDGLINTLHPLHLEDPSTGHLHVVWKHRNTANVMEWADHLAKETRLGTISPTAPTLDLRGDQPPFRSMLPRLMLDFISQAEAAGWDVVDLRTSPVKSDLSLERRVVVERGAARLVASWRKPHKTWIPARLHRSSGGTSQQVEWDQLSTELA